MYWMCNLHQGTATSNKMQGHGKYGSIKCCISCSRAGSTGRLQGHAVQRTPWGAGTRCCKCLRCSDHDYTSAARPFAASVQQRAECCCCCSTAFADAAVVLATVVQVTVCASSSGLPAGGSARQLQLCVLVVVVSDAGREAVSWQPLQYGQPSVCVGHVHLAARCMLAHLMCSWVAARHVGSCLTEGACWWAVLDGPPGSENCAAGCAVMPATLSV
jgi:hypothetical protein